LEKLSVDLWESLQTCGKSSKKLVKKNWENVFKLKYEFISYY
jgi:hypothetical protein